MKTPKPTETVRTRTYSDEFGTYSFDTDTHLVDACRKNAAAGKVVPRFYAEEEEAFRRSRENRMRIIGLAILLWLIVGAFIWGAMGVYDWWQLDRRVDETSREFVPGSASWRSNLIDLGLTGDQIHDREIEAGIRSDPEKEARK